MRIAVGVAALPFAGFLYLAVAVIDYVYFDRTDRTSIEALIRFEPPTIGEVYDSRGYVLIELAREHRRVVSYEEVPPILRQAILAAEDKNFFSHSGVDYGALPRVVQKTASHSMDAGFRLRLPQGGSTLTQQLVRSFLLQDLTKRERGDVLLPPGPGAWLLSRALGVHATNKLFRKLEETRLAVWLEEELCQRYGSKEQAKREILARYASFIYLGNGRYGFAAASDYYFGKPLSSYTTEDAGKAALLAGIAKAPRDYAPAPGDPRPLRRRNEILALMARNGYISEELATRSQDEPILVASNETRNPIETLAPAAIGSVFDELKQHGGDRFSIEDLFQGRISVRATVDGRVQSIVNEALENGLARYEKRHPEAKGWIQGAAVVLRNADAAILAEAGGRQVYGNRPTRYCDYNRVTGSLRQPGSAMKPLIYLAAFQGGLDLDTTVADEPIDVEMGNGRPAKWIANYDGRFKGLMSMRQALAESRNTTAVWIAREMGVSRILRAARELGIRTPLQPYVTTALGASEVRLLELANAYRTMASGVLAEPHVIDRVTDASGGVLYAAPRPAVPILSVELRLIQEGLRGVVRLPNGTAHALARRDFPIPVMGKTGTTSDFRDAVFVGSTYGPTGITVAVRIGFDDNQSLGKRETGARTALPVFREVMLRAYTDDLVGPVPQFPREIEESIDAYLALQVALDAAHPEEPLDALDGSVATTPREPR